MKKELDYFHIGTSYGGSQNWFTDVMMHMGGCGALAACDTCIYLECFRGKEGIYPYDKAHLTKKDYVDFGMLMKPYLKPRWSGIDTLEIYIDGFSAYLSDCKRQAVSMEPFYGTENVEKAIQVLQEQIDNGWLVPCLTLNIKNRSLKDYEWHWFLLTGYEIFEDTCMVKAVTYGSYRWIDFRQLWDTGFQRKGGLIIYRE